VITGPAYLDFRLETSLVDGNIQTSPFLSGVGR